MVTQHDKQVRNIARIRTGVGRLVDMRLACLDSDVFALTGVPSGERKKDLCHMKETNRKGEDPTPLHTNRCSTSTRYLLLGSLFPREDIETATVINGTATPKKQGKYFGKVQQASTREKSRLMGFNRVMHNQWVS